MWNSTMMIPPRLKKLMLFHAIFLILSTIISVSFAQFHIHVSTYSMYHKFLIHNQYIYLRTFQPPLPLGYPCSSIPKQNEMSEDTHCHENVVCNSEETKRYSNINGLCNNVDVPPQGAVGTDFWHLLDKRKNDLYIIVTECKWPIAIAIFLLLKLSKYVVFLCNRICCKEEVFKYFSRIHLWDEQIVPRLTILLSYCRYFESHQI